MSAYKDGTGDILSNQSWHANYTNNSVVDQFQHTPDYLAAYVTILNVLIFSVGVFGNTLVIAAVCKVREMRDPTNYFLFTLSIADLLVLLICQPVAIMELYSKDRWFIGEFMCKFFFTCFPYFIFMYLHNLWTFQILLPFCFNFFA